MLKCDIMTYSKVQERAIKEIEKITEHFGNDRWFTQDEVTGIGANTMTALVEKKYLNDQQFSGIIYYKIRSESK